MESRGEVCVSIRMAPSGRNAENYGRERLNMGYSMDRKKFLEKTGWSQERSTEEVRGGILY